MADEPKKPESEKPGSPTLGSDLEARIEPALKLLKEVLAAAEKLREKDAGAKAAEEQLRADQFGAEVVGPLEGKIYVSIDGDGIGNQVMRAEEKNDEAAIKEVDGKIKQGQAAFSNWVIRHGGEVLEEGGDEGLAKVPSTAASDVETLRAEYKNSSGATATVGIGETIKDASQARMLGKLRGKDQVVTWSAASQEELALRLEQRGPETPEKKLLDAGLGSTEDDKPSRGKYAVPRDVHERDLAEFEDYQNWRKGRKQVAPGLSS